MVVCTKVWSLVLHPDAANTQAAAIGHVPPGAAVRRGSPLQISIIRVMAHGA